MLLYLIKNTIYGIIKIMAYKVSLKSTVFLLISFLLLIILPACMSPVDLEKFLKDPDVEKFIEDNVNPETRTRPQPAENIVKVDDQTRDGLKGGDQFISGLKTDKYYMVEKEVDTDGNPVDEDFYPAFVTDYPGVGPGGLWNDLALLTNNISGGKINGLTNKHTYTVRAAEPFQNGIELQYTDAGVNESKRITGGILDISGITGECFLNLTRVLEGSYKVIAVSSDNSENSWLWTSQTISSWGSIKLEGENTETDYVFVKEDDPSDFRVLRIKIGQKVQTGIKITITFTNTEGITVSPISSSTSITIGALNGNSSVVLRLTPTGGTLSNIKWYCDDSEITGETSSTITLSNTNTLSKLSTYLVVGNHIITATADIGGTPYSANFTLTVTE